MRLPLVRLAQLAALFTGVQIGSTLVATRIALDELGPMALGFLRYGLAALCLIPAYLASARTVIAPTDKGPLLLLGIGQFALLAVFLNLGLVFISPDRVAVAFATLPLVTMLAAALLGAERMSLRLGVAGMLAVAGVALAFSADLAQAGEGLAHEVVGIACVLVATLTVATCSVLFGPYLRRYPTVQVGTVAMVSAACALLPLAIGETWALAPGVLSAATLVAVAYVGISSGAGFLLWLFALKHAAPTQTTLLTSTSPLVAALVSAWLLDTQLRAAVFQGFALVFAALLLCLGQKRSTVPPP
ncbi:DMT family transporter [Lutibaculum baratangense]|uniref:EamA domain-containing protein n=1 Tax=Lutibaculum baratangense AMV1 TaxID=631454 RepID=V4RNT9_9HYPH|nr:DMT family transporter [Lutibaculum baratangense]ESR26904.1 hypothetical protein N177_0688 [Lutibaculum baratangense AMV1]